MAYLDAFRHDVFVSYAHVDNRPDREGERGWVESFERSLTLRLLKRFGREVKVWRDPALARSQRFDPVIEAAVQGSAIMIALLSRSHLASDYCQQELNWFATKAAREPAGLTVDHHVRVFPVLLYNVPPDEWPGACRGTSGFRFHDATGSEFGKPLRPDRDEFADRLCELVEDLHTVLTTMKKVEGGQAKSSAAAATATRVFLADVSDEMRRNRRLLKGELEKAGIEVLDSIPPPDAPAQHETAAIEALQGASLSVHLLGAFPGRPLDEDRPETTYATEQLRLGLEHARSQLVVQPPGFEAADIQEPDYARLITSLQTRQREADRLEIIQTLHPQLAQEVTAKLRQLERRDQAVQPRAGAGTAFVDLHVNDLSIAGDLVGYLSRQDLPAITIPSGDLDPASGLSLFEEHLHRARVFIVVFGRVARSWVEQRLNEAFKLILSHRLTTRVGVYLAPPHKSAIEATFPPFFKVLNNTESFDPHTLDDLLRGSE